MPVSGRNFIHALIYFIMETSKIEHFITSSMRNNATIDIQFKGRSSLTGLFVRGSDYDELKSKNFWRVVQLSQLQQWSETNNINFAKIFNGASFTSLAETKR